MANSGLILTVIIARTLILWFEVSGQWLHENSGQVKGFVSDGFYNILGPVLASHR